MRTTFLTMVMIASLSSGCLESSGPAAKANNRSTKEEIQAAATKTEVVTGQDTSTSTGDETLGVPPDHSLTYFDHTKVLLDTYCASCHGNPAASGASSDFTLASYDTVGGLLGVYAKRDRVAARIEAGSMPLGTTLPDEAKTKILGWIAAGAPRGADPSSLLPTVTFEAPATAAEVPTLGSFTIRVAFTKVPEDSYYNLYYSTTGATTGGTAIMTDIPTTDLTTPWLTSALATGGDYYVYLELFDGEGSKLLTKGSVGTVHVDNSTPTNHAPTVTLTGIFDGSSQALGTLDKQDDVPLGFTATDQDGDAVTVRVEYQASAAGAFVEIHPAGSQPTGLTWDTSALSTGATYRIRVTATDGTLSTAKTSQGPIGITDQNYTFAAAPIASIMTGVCNTCHAGKVGGFDSSDTGSATSYASEIISRVNSTNAATLMPKPPTLELDDDQKAQLQLWYWQDAL